MASDIVCEYMVKRKLSVPQIVKAAAIIMGGFTATFVISSLGAYADRSGMMGAMLLMIGIGVTIFFGRWLIMIEYEYAYFNGEITFDKILAKSKRRHLMDVDLKTVEKMGRPDDEAINSLKVDTIKDYSESNSTGRYCKIGRFIDCQSALDSKGSRFWRFLRLSDLGFLFFSTQLFLVLISNNGWQTFSLILLIIGCCFTVYSVVYQTTVIHKVCLYCMSVNLITWLDTILITTNAPLPNVGTPYIFIFSVLTSYLIWSFTVRNMSLSRQTYSLRKRLSVLYRKGLFEWLLSQERELEEISDNYAECSGINGTDTITVFVYPQCKKCKTVEAAISQLSQIARVKIVSLAAKAPEVRLYCERNQIVRTPTIVVDGHELPKVYDIGDQKYILKS